MCPTRAHHRLRPGGRRNNEHSGDFMKNNEHRPAEDIKPVAMPRGLKSKMRTRKKLIDSVQRLIAVKGFEQMTIEDITNGADVGFGTFYNHFHSKEDIATALFLEKNQELERIIGTINQAEHDRALSITYVQKLFLTQAIQNEIWGWFIVRSHASHKAMSDSFNEQAKSDIAEGVAIGRFDVACVEAAAQITIAGLIAAMRSLLEGQAPPNIVNNTIECFMRLYGLTPAEARDIASSELPAYVTTLFHVNEGTS
ncbi:TetR/AcrR family transcriptional regulator [Pseudomonas sp. S37]|uniref:TetR/AcrR family transcriptional regulator n=1 Tax=Pseudomonas sp. S37 TaxID=2767449 RepID=UPI001914651E|nr:TetR/AcrR family transcriptional regulator [Pseudomonas sp. S37]MBK4994872.1 TetR/AcrR family transcriptional regulator [Pseudomonas sp. S37]